MKVFTGLETVEPPLTRSVLTIGNFDGVHRAHQQLLAQAGLFAANTSGPVVALTFEPHPMSVVAPDKAPARLQPVEEKLRCLAEAGADVAVVAKSEPALLDLEPEAFVEDVICKRFNPTHVVEGPSFGFGHGRRGTPEMLRQIASRFDCEVRIVDPVTLQIDSGETLLVSSSLIRQLIIEGKVHRAALCLGRPYALIGEVVEGEGRGRTIGYPTANLYSPEQLLPADGVYAGCAKVGESRLMSAISIGSAPTFAGARRCVEAHLLDFDGDLYGQSMRLEFDRPLRPQQTFDSAEALTARIRADVELVRRGANRVNLDSPNGKEPTT